MSRTVPFYEGQSSRFHLLSGGAIAWFGLPFATLALSGLPAGSDGAALVTNEIANGLSLAMLILVGMGVIAYIVSRFYQRPPDALVPLNLQFQPRSMSGSTIRITVLFRIRQSQNIPPKITGLYEEMDAAFSLYYAKIPADRIHAVSNNDLAEIASIAMKAAYQHYAVEIAPTPSQKLKIPA